MDDMATLNQLLMRIHFPKVQCLVLYENIREPCVSKSSLFMKSLYDRVLKRIHFPKVQCLVLSENIRKPCVSKSCLVIKCLHNQILSRIHFPEARNHSIL